MKTYSEAPPAPRAPMQRHALNGATMGTRYSAVFFADAEVDDTAIGAALSAAADRVDRQMSTWKSDSDLSRLNATPVNQWVALPDETLVVLDAALRVGAQSSGAFDIAVGDLVNAWGFGPAGPRPDLRRTSALGAQQRHSACEALDVDLVQKRARKRAAMTLDLSGIAKGYGVDALAGCLDSFGITRYLVGIDGEMRARGHKPDGRAWAVAIEKPVPGVREVMGVMELADAAIATSGTYRHWVEVEGVRHAHSMNPLQRQPARNRLVAVSVVMPRCMLADAWATALLVLGESAGVALAEQRGMDALFVLHDGDALQQIAIVDGVRQP